MSSLYIFVWLYLNIALEADSVSSPSGLPSTVYSSLLSCSSTCPSQDTVSEEHRRVRDTLLGYSPTPCSCGGPGWTRVAYLNMSDTNQQCPSNWTLTTSPVRGCGRTTRGSISCDSAFYSVKSRTYSTVCGRINAYQKGHSFAFFNLLQLGNTLDQSYISGVSVTHGPAGNRSHIWSFVGALSELPSSVLNCPCTDTNVSWTHQIPPFIDNDYFCDTGSRRNISPHQYYTEDPLWDGKGCGPASTCCSFNSPPWFCKSLPQPTSEDLEIRLCNENYITSEDRLIFFMEIYVK